jgi:PAS domain S-box-containing protein
MNELLISSLLFLSGICALAALNHLFIGLRRPRVPAHIFFALLCIAALLLGVSFVVIYRATTVAEYVAALRFGVACNMVFFLFLPWFIAEYTRVRPVPLLAVFSVLFAVLFLVNLFEPYTLQYQSIQDLTYFQLPWGEVVSRLAGVNSNWFSIGAVAVWSVFGFAFYALNALYRRGRKRAALFMMLAIALLLLVSVQGILVRAGVINFIPLGVYGFLAMILVMHMALNYEARQSADQLKSILDHIPAVVYLKDTEGRYLMVNRQFEDFFNSTKSTLLGKTDFDVFPKAQAEAFRDSDKKVLASCHAIELEEIVNKDNQQRTYFTVKFPLLHSDGVPYAVCCLSTNITERKEAEVEHDKLRAQLLQSQKMESIGHLAGGIAHDFNNMLGAILGFAELIRQLNNASRLTPEHIQKYTAEILTSGNRAKDLISQMLTFSRLNPEASADDMPVMLLQPMVKELTQLLRASIPSTINLNYRIEDEDLRVRIKPVQLHQILMNLVINARDAMGEYGDIDITLARYMHKGICDSCHQNFDGEYAALTVHDNGENIPDYILRKIFDPFFTTKIVGKGTGMGLSVVHGIVHSLGGHITVSSSATTGVTMNILLPMTVQAADIGKEIKSVQDFAGGELEGLRIMVVDDEHAMSSMLTEMLVMYGAQVESYNLPLQALAAFERNPRSYDLLITDEAMPELSGFDLSKRILKLHPAQVILLCTGYSAQVTDESARKAGITGFMHKPLDIAILLEWIRKHMQHPQKSQA